MKATQVGMPAPKNTGQKRSKGERLAQQRALHQKRSVREEKLEIEQSIPEPPKRAPEPLHKKQRRI